MNVYSVKVTSGYEFTHYSSLQHLVLALSSATDATSLTIEALTRVMSMEQLLPFIWSTSFEAGSLLQDMNLLTGTYFVNIPMQNIIVLRHWFYVIVCSTFEENIGNNGIFTVAYSPLSFDGTNKFIRNRGTDSLRVSWHNVATVHTRMHAHTLSFLCSA